MTRADLLAQSVAEHELDMLIVGDLVSPGDSGREQIADVFWLAGFTGTSGMCLVGPDLRMFLTDFRYTERAAKEVVDEFDRVTADRQLVPSLADRLRGRVGFDETRTSVRVHTRLLEEAGPEVELVPAAGLVAALRRHKDEDELSAIGEAARVADEVYRWVAEQGLLGRTECDVARSAQARIRELGAEPSFPPIVAAGPNGALPHANPSDREIGAGELVVFDMGALVDGYCSDCTRTYAAGEPDGEAKEVYELVARAHAAGMDAVGPGVAGRDADAAARDVIEQGGHGEHFGHGLGHGVGIDIHEAPTLGKRSEQTLEPGDVVTVEPGVYLPGRLGVRIEDLVTITDDGCHVFTDTGRELQILS